MGNLYTSIKTENIKKETTNNSTILNLNSTDPVEKEHLGTFNELHIKCKNVMPYKLEGAHISITKGLSKYFQIYHNFILGTPSMNGYKFGTSYVGNNTFEEETAESYPILYGEIDPQGNLNANIIHKFNSNLRSKFAYQIQNNEIIGGQLTTDYLAKDSSVSISLANINLIKSSGILIASYLQNITKNLALGTELVYQYGVQIPGNRMTAIAAALIYKHGPSLFTGTLGVNNIHLSYYQKARSQQLEIAVEFDTNIISRESTISGGFRIDLPNLDCTLRGMIDNKGIVHSIIERKLSSLLPITFALSGLMNYKKNDFKLGIGINIG